MLRAEASGGWPTADGGSQERLTHNVTGRSRNARTIADHVDPTDVNFSAASGSDAVGRVFHGMHQDSGARAFNDDRQFGSMTFGDYVDSGGSEDLRSASADGRAARQASTSSRASAYGPHAVQDESDSQCGLSRQSSGTCTACGPLTPRPRPTAAPCGAHSRAKRRRTARVDWRREQVEIALDFLAAAMPLDGGGGIAAFTPQAVAPYKQAAPAPAALDAAACRASGDACVIPCQETTAEWSCARAVSTTQEQCPLFGGAALGWLEPQRATAPFAAWALREAAGRAAAAGTVADASAAEHFHTAEEEARACAAAASGPSRGVAAAELSTDAGASAPYLPPAGESYQTVVRLLHADTGVLPPSPLTPLQPVSGCVLSGGGQAQHLPGVPAFTVGFAAAVGIAAAWGVTGTLTTGGAAAVAAAAAAAAARCTIG